MDLHHVRLSNGTLLLTVAYVLDGHGTSSEQHLTDASGRDHDSHDSRESSDDSSTTSESGDTECGAETSACPQSGHVRPGSRSRSRT